MCNREPPGDWRAWLGQYHLQGLPLHWLCVHRAFFSWNADTARFPSCFSCSKQTSSHSWGIETAQFHCPVVLSSGFQHRPVPTKTSTQILCMEVVKQELSFLLWHLRPWVNSAVEWRKHLPKSVVPGTLSHATVEQRQVEVINMLARKGGGWTLGEPFLRYPVCSENPLHVHCARHSEWYPTLALNMCGATMGKQTTEPNVPAKVLGYKPLNPSLTRRLALEPSSKVFILSSSVTSCRFCTTITWAFYVLDSFVKWGRMYHL